MLQSREIPPELTGERLHGEGLDDAGLRAWFADEQDGYANIVGDAGSSLAGGGTGGGTGEDDRFHAFEHLGNRRFACCLALGAAQGDEFEALTGRVGRFVAIEPGRSFWQDRIAGAPADYRAPTLRGAIDLPDGACDIAGSFGVLHHIPNVSEVLCEVARVLAPGAPFLVREPIVSLGDFRAPRPGLTRNERGIPHRLMDAMLADAGFAVRAKSFAVFPGLDRIARSVGMAAGANGVWDHRGFVRLDAAVSRLMAWNVRYWRPRLWHKAAPSMGYWVAERQMPA
ncbi:class I SAM-dependent methyltransferase [Novosphingobium lentum]|uniref:class I SAM-dependent methyltransferase n=1 Tax=Novosphingobium lentum TaxID=145287 RepID=UPI00082C3FE1|nr:methyltransferase domain-containing protein [Novosphingobium lentum]